MPGWKPLGKPHEIYREMEIHPDPWFVWGAFTPGSLVRIGGGRSLKACRREVDEYLDRVEKFKKEAA